MLRTRLAILAGTASLLAAPVVHGQNLLVNGGFEAGSLLGWTTAIHGDPACANAYQVNAMAAITGSYGLSSGLPAPGCIFNSNTIVSQFLTTTPGQQYNLSYTVKQAPGAPRNDCPNVSLGCGNFFTIRWKDYVSPDAPFNIATGVFDFSPIFGTFAISTDITSMSSTTEIEIEMWAQRDFWFVDDVNVHALSTVPEPSTYALMAVALAGLGIVARRRNRK